MQRFFFTTGAVLSGLAVAMGAATGHGDTALSEMALIWIEKATRYQFYHGLALLAVAIGMQLWQEQRYFLNIAGWCFAGGTICFSGSLYLMAFSGIPAGYLTPLGGMGFLAGWLVMAIAGLKLTPPWHI